ncbi:MAG: T9SS type A sorting domain-containing protein, partial [Bacteroidota bacterium]
LGGYGPECHFMFPGNSDSLNWGVGCMQPNGPVNWTETTAHNNPGDRRGVCSTGPITFKPGDRQDIDIAFAWARDYQSNDPNASLIKLEGVVDKINNAFINNKLPDGTPIYGINEHQGFHDLKFRIYPNPAKDLINLDFVQNPYDECTIKLISTAGNVLREIHAQKQEKVSINISTLANGVYIIQCQSKSSVGTRKFIVMK